MNAGAIADLDPVDAASVASLVAIGTQSGATVVGLSAVRRCVDLAFLFLDAELSPGTVSELVLRASRSNGSCQVFRLPDLTAITRGFGRVDARVVGVRQGDLANGIAGKLSPA